VDPVNPALGRSRQLSLELLVREPLQGDQDLQPLCQVHGAAEHNASGRVTHPPSRAASAGPDALRREFRSQAARVLERNQIALLLEAGRRLFEDCGRFGGPAGE
jgi:hypothetical protein